MRLIRSALLPATLLLGACTGTAIIDGVTPLAGGDPVTDDDDDPIGDDDDDVVETSPFEGDYTTDAILWGAFWEGGDEREFCTGFIDLAVDADGVLNGAGECTIEWGGGSSILLAAAGTITDDGVLVDGVMETAFARNPEEVDSDPLSGEFTERSIDLAWRGVIEFGFGGDVEYDGKAFLE